MSTNLYKVIPFSEVAAGQEFEDVSHHNEMSTLPWTKEDCRDFNNLDFQKGCLVRIADCKPDFDAGESSVENVLSSILTAMKDIQNSADDTLWINNSETVFERLWEIYIIHGGSIETLKESFPLCA